MRTRWKILFSPLIGLLMLPAQAAVTEYHLDNGLKLIVKEDHRAPVVVSQVWYRVGSSYEHNGITGISHVLEHMMFKGTRKHAPGEFSRIISANGGRENAFTSQDYTAYFQTMEKSRLKVSFELEADRMRGLLLPPKEFEKEVQVVMEERRMRTEDKPQSLTYERFNAAAFTSSPYRIPTIGWMDDLKHLKVSDLRKWYQKWYAPNNAIVVVVGDVKPDDVFQLAKQYFGPLKPSKIAPPKPQSEPPSLGMKQIEVKAPAQLPYLLMGYQVPSLKTATQKQDAYALEVLAGILDGGNSARLTTRLVRKQGVLSSVGAGYDLYDRLGTQLLLEAVPAQGQTVDQAKQALLKQVKELQEKPVTREELDRVKAQVVAGKVYERDSVFYQAMQIGTLESVGLGWRVMDEYVKNIQAVTPGQIQAVARKYLVQDDLTIARLNPQPMDAKARRKAMMGGTHGRH